MVRGSTLARTLQVPKGCVVEVRAVPPTGDCFYDCLDLLLPDDDEDADDNEDEKERDENDEEDPENHGRHSSSFSPSPSSSSRCRRRRHRRKPTLATPQAMRNLVADRMTQELFDLYAMYASAGLKEYAWMTRHRAPANLEELRAFARRVGRDAGAGHCLWADEHAIRTLVDEARATLLIIDEQATSRRGLHRSGFRRKQSDGGDSGNGNGGGNANRQDGDAARDGRFLAIGSHEDNCLMLLRSRRQHYDAVIIDHRRTFRIDELPDATRSLWWPAVGDGRRGSESAKAEANGKKNAKGEGRRATAAEDEDRRVASGGKKKHLTRNFVSATSSSKPRKKAKRK